MPGSFRRAQLRGSEELFRSTRPDPEAEPAPPPSGARAAGIGRGPAAPARAEPEESVDRRPEGHLVRLTDEEVDIIVDAIQRMKYPTATKVPTKPPMDVFERLEELRQKILGAHT